MKYCPTCGNAVDDAVKFCFRCGHAFPVAPVYPAETPAADAPLDSAAVPETEAPVAAEPVDGMPAAETAVPETQDPSPFVMETSAPESALAPEPAVAPEPAPAFVPTPEPAHNAPQAPQKPRKELLSTVQYILLILLFCIPVVGLVCLFIFGCGNPKNTSLKRFSLAVLILTLIVWILLIAAAIVCYVAYADTLSTFLRSFQQWFSALDLSALKL